MGTGAFLELFDMAAAARGLRAEIAPSLRANPGGGAGRADGGANGVARRRDCAG
jgi:hypothetical protein